jgi:hypothetical protein
MRSDPAFGKSGPTSSHLGHFPFLERNSFHPGEPAGYKSVTGCFKSVTILHSAHDTDALQ